MFAGTRSRSAPATRNKGLGASSNGRLPRTALAVIIATPATLPSRKLASEVAELKAAEATIIDYTQRHQVLSQQLVEARKAFEARLPE